MTTHLKSEVDALRAKLAAAEQELEAWRSYDRGKGVGAPADAELVDDVEKIWALRKAHPRIRTNVAARLAIALHATSRPLSYGRMEQLIPMSWARDDGERRDPRGYFSVLICFLRNSLGFSAIENIQGYGYALTPVGRAQLDAIWGPKESDDD